MAGSTFKITVDDSGLSERLRRMANAVDTGDLMPRLGEYLARSTERRFDTQTKPNGTKWAKLTERYRRRKKANRDKVLTLSGYLRGYIRWQQISPTSVAVGTNVPYAAVHQLGANYQRKATVRYHSVAKRVIFAKKTQKVGVTERRVTMNVKIEARPFLGVSSEDEVNIREIVADWHARQLG